MSGAFGGFGGFGQNSQQQQSTGFGATSGGFGANTGTGGFGQTSNTGFGTTNNANPGGGLFGGNTGGFGANTGAFGANNQQPSLFGGAKPNAFGQSTTTSGSTLFGNTAATTSAPSAFGGFGATSANTGAFGTGGTQSSTLFGQNNQAKPGGFGVGNPSLFGAGGFGTTNSTTNAFGAPTSTALGPNIPPSDGTAKIPFQAKTEKENNATVHYQNIACQEPYQNYSQEELRVADYQQGRRFGNASNQPGSFGLGSGFGTFGQTQNQTQSTGFGASNTSTLFGSGNTNTTSNPFGTTQTSTAFGGNTGGSLFGNQPKSSAPSLFGNTSTAPAGGSLFGGSTFNQPTTTNSFGGTGSNMFGGAATTKPGGLFGSTTTTAFGQSNTSTASNPFGAASTAPFGQQAQQQNAGSTGFSGFGQQPQQQQNQATGTNAFGGNAFGQQNQQNTNPFGRPAQPSLFGQQQPGNAFANTQQPGGGLFGGQQQQQQEPPKQSLFGNTAGFGNTQNQGSSLFGNNPAQPPKPSLFGNTQQQQPGGGLFGNTTTNTSGSSLFGNTSQNQQQQGSSFLGSGNSSSLFANSQQQQQNPLAMSQPGSMHTDLLGNNVYGSPSIFSGLPQPSSVHSGPVATPLRTPASLKKREPLPFYKSSSLNPNRMLSPMKKGYGFSYSTYGSPTTPSSTPNSSLSGGSLLGGSFGRSLGRATSLTNLRRSFDTDQPSVLAPGAFSLSGGRGFGHSVKRLDINRNLKVQPLFTSPSPTSTPTLSPIPMETTSQPSRLKKRVSFDDGALGNRHPSDMNGALVPTETNGPEPTAEELGFLRSRRGNDSNGVSNGASHLPEMEQVRGNELAIVPEDEVPPPPPAQRKRPGDPEPGDYWSKPSMSELQKMSQAELKQLRNFEVGRQGCGSVHFDQPVDLTTIKLDDLFGGVVSIGIRMVTVYVQSSSTPPVGTGLNVPSTIVLENSWARVSKTLELVKSNPQQIEKHIAKLKKTPNTHFVNFDPRTGFWTFRVDHFTTYEMYDDDDTELESLNQSTLSAPPDTPTPKSRTSPGQHYVESAQETSSEESDLEDTYDFKKKVFPGAFNREAAFEEDDEMEQEETINEPFLEDRSTGSPSVDDQGSVRSEEESGSDEEMEMAGAFPKPIPSVEQDNASPPKSMFGQSQQPQWTPGKVSISFESTWAEQLQRTVSPKKQDRDALREIQGNALIDIEPESSTKAPSKEVKTKGFRNSIDLMSSLFGKHEQQRLGRKQSVEGKGFEWPYSKKPKTFAGDGTDMTDADVAFHHSFKSTFNPRDEYLLLKPKGTAPRTKTPMPETHLRTVGNFELMTKSLISKKNLPDLQSEQMHFQKSRTEISDFDEIPVASMESTSFGSLASLIDIEQTAVDPLAMQEKQIWSLAFILFDDFTDDVSLGVPDDLRDEFAHRVRKDRLCRFWRDIVVKEKVAKDLAKNLSREEDAIVHLTAGNVKAACTSLLEAKDFHLTTLVAQAPGDQVFREGIRGQIDEWRESNMLSEMTDPIRALYEILAGNACKVDGVKGQLVDRASEFIISERFNLSWQQAFALRLWYVIYEDEPLEEAIISFDNDIMSFADSAWPSPFDDDKRKDLEAQKAEWLISPLWTLLQIYAASKSPASKFNPSIELPAQIMPKTITGDIFNTRLTFQLYHALCARKKEGQLKFRTSPTLSDQLTVDFASQIAASGQFIFAALIFLYLTNPDERARSIKELLARNAPFIPERDSSPLADDIWSSFCGDLLLPEPWIWEALALHARSYRNCPEDSLDDATLAHAVAPSDEVRYLLEAENWDEAHSTLCRVVAPTAIIEREYEALVTLLLGFQDQPEHKVKGWDVGGGVYMDFVNIMLGRVEGKDRGAVLGRLVEGLTRMKGKGGMAFQESVAMREMAGTVADLVGEERGKNKNRAVVPAETVLRMPLTGDQKMRKALEAGLGYYGAVMAGV